MYCFFKHIIKSSVCFNVMRLHRRLLPSESELRCVCDVHITVISLSDNSHPWSLALTSLFLGRVWISHYFILLTNYLMLTIYHLWYLNVVHAGLKASSTAYSVGHTRLAVLAGCSINRMPRTRSVIGKLSPADFRHWPIKFVESRA